MKKTILFLMLLVVCISASARKSYITLWTPDASSGAPQSNPSIQLTGDVPDNIEGFVYSSDYHYWFNKPSIRKYSTGEILNLLSGYGFEVEFVDNDNKSFLLSKEIPSNQTLIEGDVNNDGEVTISDVNKVINIILGIVRENPSLLEQYGIIKPE